MRHAEKIFLGIDYFPIDPSWHIVATWVPFNPAHKLEIGSVIGTIDKVDVPGKAVRARRPIARAAAVNRRAWWRSVLRDRRSHFRQDHGAARFPLMALLEGRQGDSISTRPTTRLVYTVRHLSVGVAGEPARPWPTAAGSIAATTPHSAAITLDMQLRLRQVQRPLNSALRFSRNAVVPSRMSSVENASAKPWVSNSRP